MHNLQLCSLLLFKEYGASTLECASYPKETEVLIKIERKEGRRERLGLLIECQEEKIILKPLLTREGVLTLEQHK